MNRAVSGTLTQLGTGRPLTGFQVVAFRVLGEGFEPLGAVISGDYGRFRIVYQPLPEAANLTVLVFSTSGRFIFAEPVHRLIDGAELRLQIEVPGSAIGPGEDNLRQNQTIAIPFTF